MRNRQFHLSLPVKDIKATKKFYQDIFACPVQDIDENSIAIDFYGNNIVFAQTKDFLPMKFPVVELEIKEQPDFPPIPLFHFGAILELEEFGKFAENLLRQDVKFIVKPMVTNEGQENEHRMTFFSDPSGYPIEMKALKGYELDKIKKWSHYKEK
jgi:uncharacterized protein